jgi:hypothetical protein
LIGAPFLSSLPARQRGGHSRRAQQPAKLLTIGILGTATPPVWSTWTAAFVQRLRELGWIEGRNVALEYRWAHGEMREVEATAQRLGLEVSRLEIRRAQDITPAFEAHRDGSEALYVVVAGLVSTNRTRIITHALSARLPTIFNNREHVGVKGHITRRLRCLSNPAWNQGRSGLRHCKPGKRAKSPSVEHSVRPCSMASAARCASETRSPYIPGSASNCARTVA